jgi:hypothetical protein
VTPLSPYFQLHTISRDLHVDLIKLRQRLVDMPQDLRDPVIRLEEGMNVRLGVRPHTRKELIALTESSAASSSSNLDSIASAEPFFAALPTPAVQSKPSSISSTLLSNASSAEALSASTVSPAAPGRIPVRDVSSTSRENAVLTGTGWNDFLR